MDGVDFAILRAMGMKPYLQGIGRDVDGIARTVGLGRKATRTRIQDMERDGVIAGYAAFPNLRSLGCRWSSYHVRIPSSRKSAFFAMAREVDGVVSVADFVGDHACVDVCYADDAEEEERLSLLSRAAGVSPHELFENPRPRVDRAPSDLDWRIIAAQRADPRATQAEIAQTLGVTARTVRARTSQLVKEGNLWLIPIVDPSKLRHGIPFMVLAYLSPEAPRGSAASLRKAAGHRLMYSWEPADAQVGHFGAMLIAPTTGAIEEARAELERIEGVERVELLVAGRLEVQHGWLDAAIAAKLRPSSSSGRIKDRPLVSKERDGRLHDASPPHARRPRSRSP